MLRKWNYFRQDIKRKNPVAARSKAWGCGRSLTWITYSIPDLGMDVSLSLSISECCEW